MGIADLMASPTGGRVAASDGSVVTVIDPAGGGRVVAKREFDDRVRLVAYAGTGGPLAYTVEKAPGGSSVMNVYDVRLQVFWQMPFDAPGLNALDGGFGLFFIISDGRLAVLVDKPEEARVFDMATHQPLARLPKLPAPVCDGNCPMYFSADRRLLYVLSEVGAQPSRPLAVIVYDLGPVLDAQSARAENARK